MDLAFETQNEFESQEDITDQGKVLVEKEQDRFKSFGRNMDFVYKQPEFIVLAANY